MSHSSSRKRKRPVKAMYLLLISFVVLMGVRIAWNTLSSAAGPTPLASSPFGTSQAGQSDSLHSKFRIVIDAGHGGKDPGATGVSGAYEKEFNLSLAERIHKLLEQDPMFEARMTRSDDRFIELEDRAEIANAWEADAFVSIHGNTFHDPAVSGTEILYTAKSSLPLAQALQEQVAAALGIRDRGSKQGEYVVLSAAHMPAVIVETGYLTHPEEESMLLSDEGQQRAAQAVYEGLKTYFSEQTPGRRALGASHRQGGNKILFNGSSREGKRVALTFDDGPDQTVTPQILDILKDNDIKATFFLLGNRVQAHPDMARRIAEEGHAIGNHSWAHPKFDDISMEEALEEIENTQRVLEDTIGYRPNLFRPPYGALQQDKLDRIAEMNLAVVNWTVDTMDWSGVSTEEIMERVREQIYPGGIVLQHSAGGKNGLENTVEALEQIISELRAEGYSFMTVSELLHLPDPGEG
ncbi:N-acetylmuramoyl-L-alanine amidase [Cohnella hongkongensis]|uniref:N-acetylmuramoyl-L-alanine amidase n=1 Tax=Cohnella hongkongensis TaxID=178337 RepID=A0ABV9F741_9BACL